MSTANFSNSNSTTFRFTSIEPISPLNERLRDIATNNGCDLEFQSEKIVNAPFCGIDYHVQDVCLISALEGEHHNNVARCVVEFDRIEADHLADGFFEIVQP